MFPLPPTIPSQNTRCMPTVVPAVCNEPDNIFNRCAQQEAKLWDTIAQSPMFQLQKFPQRYWNLSSLPFVQMPPDALRLNEGDGIAFSSITLANVPVPVFTYLVPTGYDGVINVTVNRFVPQTGPTFQDGSGQLVWSIGTNNTLAVNYTNIRTSLGSFESLGPVTEGGGIRIKANDLITYYVRASAGAIAALDPAGIVACAIQGWLYPSR